MEKDSPDDLEKNTRPYDPRDMPYEFEKEITRLRNQALFLWKKERIKLAQLGLEKGMKVLDLGCGPGFIARLLVEDFPGIKLTGIDLDLELLEIAKNELKDSKSLVRLVHSSAEKIPFPDNYFDFVYARLVFQHIPEPSLVSREVFRVLKPGGIFVIHDIDQEILGVIEPDFPLRDQLSKKFSKAQEKKGGNRYIGRRLLRMLKEAGFTSVLMDGLVAHSDELGTEGFEALAGDREMIDTLEKKEYLTKEEANSLRAFYDKFQSDPDKIILLITFLARGVKPSRAT